MTTRRIRSLPLAAAIGHVRSPLYGNAYALMLSSGLTSGLGVAYWVLAAHQYSTKTVGLNAAAISTMMFLSGMSQLNLTGVMIRFVPRAGRATARLVAVAYLASVLAAAVVSFIFILGLDLWSPGLDFLRANPLSALSFVLATMAWCIFVLQDCVLTGLRQAQWVPVENAAYALAKIALLVVFAALFPGGGIFASWTLPMVVVLLPTNLLIFKRLIPAHVRRTHAQAEPLALARIVPFAAGDYLGSLFYLASTTVLPIMVTRQAGASANAYFYLCWVIASSFQLISVSMTMSLTVEGTMDQAAMGVYGYRALVQLGRLLSPLIVVALIGAPYILRIFGDSYATNATMLLRLLILAAIPHMINAVCLSIARVQRRMTRIVVAQGLLCGLALTLSHLLLPIYGIAGIGCAWLASQMAVAVVLLGTGPRPALHAFATRRFKEAS